MRSILWKFIAKTFGIYFWNSEKSISAVTCSISDNSNMDKFPDSGPDPALIMLSKNRMITTLVSDSQVESSTQQSIKTNQFAKPMCHKKNPSNSKRSKTSDISSVSKRGNYLYRVFIIKLMILIVKTND